LGKFSSGTSSSEKQELYFGMVRYISDKLLGYIKFLKLVYCLFMLTIILKPQNHAQPKEQQQHKEAQSVVEQQRKPKPKRQQEPMQRQQQLKKQQNPKEPIKAELEGTCKNSSKKPKGSLSKKSKKQDQVTKKVIIKPLFLNFSNIYQ
jgi:hypothetical protein